MIIPIFIFLLFYTELRCILIVVEVQCIFTFIWIQKEKERSGEGMPDVFDYTLDGTNPELN